MIFGFNTDVKYGTTVYHVQSEAREHELLLQTQVFMKGRCIGKHAVSYADKMALPGFSDEQMHQLLKDQHKRIVEAARAGRVEQEITHTSPVPAAPVAAQPTPAPPPAPVEPRKTTAPQPAQALVEAVALATAEPPAVQVEPPPPEEPAEVPTSQPTSVLPVRLTRSTLSPSIAGDYSMPEQAAPLPFEFPPEEPEAPQASRITAEAAAPAASHGLSVDCVNPEEVFSDGVFRLRMQVSDEGQPLSGVQLTWRLNSGANKLMQAYVVSDPAGLAEIKFESKEQDLQDLNVLVQASHRGKSVSRRFRFRKS